MVEKKDKCGMNKKLFHFPHLLFQKKANTDSFSHACFNRCDSIKVMHVCLFGVVLYIFYSINCILYIIIICYTLYTIYHSAYSICLIVYLRIFIIVHSKIHL